MKAIVKKGLFDLMDDFLKDEEKRINHMRFVVVSQKELIGLCPQD